MLESLKADFRSAFSALRHRPGVAVAVISTLYLVIGVMPRGFDYLPGTEIFLPLVFTPEQLANRVRPSARSLVQPSR